MRRSSHQQGNVIISGLRNDVDVASRIRTVTAIRRRHSATVPRRKDHDLTKGMLNAVIDGARFGYVKREPVAATRAQCERRVVDGTWFGYVVYS